MRENGENGVKIKFKFFLFYCKFQFLFFIVVFVEVPSLTAKQRNSETAKQRNSETAKQRNSETAKQRNSEKGRGVFGRILFLIFKISSAFLSQLKIPVVKILSMTILQKAGMELFVLLKCRVLGISTAHTFIFNNFEVRPFIIPNILNTFQGKLV
jgi:hypothetical protein